MGRRNNVARPETDTIKLAELYRQRGLKAVEKFEKKQIDKEEHDRLVAEALHGEEQAGEDAITVKRRLSHGEREEMFSRLAAGGRPTIRTETVLAYLLGWNLTDETGTALPYSPKQSLEERGSMLRNLETDVFDDIYDSVDRHAALQAEAREKNAPDGKPASAQTLPSAG